MELFVILLACVLIIVAILGGIGNSRPENIGKNGEEKVRRLLNQLPTADYHIINDIIIPSKYGTTQIDHVVLSRYGIFVIETKNYSGYIYGNENSSDWKETFPKVSHKFRNPIKQNWGHIFALSQLLGIDRYKFISIVVFSDEAQLHVTSNKPVINMRHLIDVIRSYETVILPPEQIDICEDIIRKSIVRDDEAEKEHVARIRNKIEFENSELRQGLCPKCDGKLILRHGKYGDFYGCTNYPKCRYTAKKF